jgi:hypothetical protein
LYDPAWVTVAGSSLLDINQAGMGFLSFIATVQTGGSAARESERVVQCSANG